MHPERPARCRAARRARPVGLALTTALLAIAAPMTPAVAGAPGTARAAAPRAAAALTGRRTTRWALAARANMSLSQRVGQLFMVGTPATGAASPAADQITRRHVGSVMLTGRSAAGVAATAQVSGQLQARGTWHATALVPLLVATDQEGGRVQVLSGPGFSTIPDALTQGTWSSATLRSRAGGWGSQLRAAGVVLDLAPVTDTVPSPAAAATNPPIGVLRREYGYDTATVASHATAFAQGLSDAGVSATTKHFPGLGRVTANPDTSSGVTDRTTVRGDAYVQPFRAVVDGGAGFLMMSTAYYPEIDPTHPAAFSSATVTGMVRGDLGFTGVVVSDDLGNARQVAPFSPGTRAVSFLRAGGDLVLTVNPAVLPAMDDAVLAEARRDPAFRAQADAAVLRVLQAKDNLGLLRRRTLVRHRWPIPLGPSRTR